MIIQTFKQYKNISNDLSSRRCHGGERVNRDVFGNDTSIIIWYLSVAYLHLVCKHLTEKIFNLVFGELVNPAINCIAFRGKGVDRADVT
jgi:hypothetical protein